MRFGILATFSNIVLLFPGSVRSSGASTAACALLKTVLPGNVAFPPSANYTKDNEHWAQSSSQPSKCSVEPADPKDIAIIFGVIQKTRTTWAVKSGGHAYNSGFSSTDGVLISMSRFQEITYNPSSSTVKVGAGNIWDNVYAALAPFGATVVGGRVPGVGVAGFTLGGGYSWLTQQYGLTIDNVLSYELVTPEGHVLNVTAKSYPDLFFGLRGGGNNFGIVTSFVLKTHPQGQVYGGFAFYLGDIPAIRQAIQEFDANNKDPNAAILSSYNYQGGMLIVSVYLFYDGPTPPNGTFDTFLNVPSVSQDIKAQSFLSLFQSLGQSSSGFARIAAHTVPIIRYTNRIIDTIVNQTLLLGQSGLLNITDPASFVSLPIEPFLSNLYDHSTGGAYPHSPAHPWTPFQVSISYTDPANEKAALSAIRKSAAVIQQVAIEEGQSSPDAILYNNYAQKGTDLQLLFGKNLPQLQKIRTKYDPHNILQLTDGWLL